MTSNASTFVEFGGFFHIPDERRFFPRGNSPYLKHGKRVREVIESREQKDGEGYILELKAWSI